MGTETTLGYDAGVFRKFGRNFDVRLAANYVNSANYIVTNTGSVYYSGSYTYQLDSMKFYGVEMEFNWKASEKLVIFGNYTNLGRNYDKDAKLPAAILLELPPKNKVNVNLRYSLPWKTRLAFDLKAIGERKSEGGFGLGRYSTSDISLEKTFENKITAGFFVNNMFGMDYQPVYGFQAPGRTFGIRLQFNPAKNPLTQ
jgi:outer membrane receptor protein involved in Fe transport